MTRLALLVILLAACTHANAGPVTPAAAPSGAEDLCDLDEGRWCHPCEELGSCGEQGDEGWLCCSGGFCVAVATAGDCDTGTVGWCDNYVDETTRSGQVISWCQDP